MDWMPMFGPLMGQADDPRPGSPACMWCSNHRFLSREHGMDLILSKLKHKDLRVVAIAL